MSNNILDLMTQKALAEEHVGTPNEAIAAVGGIYAQCKKELPAIDFEKLMKVSGPQRDDRHRCMADGKVGSNQAPGLRTRMHHDYPAGLGSGREQDIGTRGLASQPTTRLMSRIKSSEPLIQSNKRNGRVESGCALQ
eukprot:scaffold7349_cov173-Amphora_coffeaeformis.AAC.17